MSAPRRSARIAAKAAPKPAAVCPPAPIKVSKKVKTEELLRDVEETSYCLYNHWDEESVYRKEYLLEYIEQGRVRLNRMANNIEETLKAVRRQVPKNPEHWIKVLNDLEYGTRFVIGAIMCHMPATKEGYYIKNDADWILRAIRGDEDIWY
jgi:hypothetical protein